MSLITQAFVLGAGLGTRLQPLTDDLPKPLVPIFQKPLITFAFDHLLAAGCDKLVVNTHRLPERFADVFPESLYRDKRILFLHEPEILGTGGGIKNAHRFFGSEPFVIYGKWFNIGSAKEDLEVHRMVCEEQWKPAYLDPNHQWPTRRAPSAVIDPTATLSGFYSLGANCRIEKGVRLRDTIVWPGAQ